MKLAYLSLGSNIGDKKKYLYDAIKLLDGYKGIHIVKLSSLYDIFFKKFIFFFYNVISLNVMQFSKY